MKTLRVALALLGSSLALARPAWAQTVPVTADLSASIGAAQKQYAAAFTAHSQLLNGPEYLDYSKRYHVSTGHQYFLSPEKQAGSVTYDGRMFTNLRLAYDVVLDQVVLSPPSSPVMLRLINEKVRGFTLNERHFVRLLADSASDKVIRTGYYEVLFDSGVQLLAKRSKLMQERIRQPYIDVEFSSKDKLYLRKDGRYYPVASKRSVLRLLADRSKDMQAFLQLHRFRFEQEQREASIVQLVRHYAGLPPR